MNSSFVWRWLVRRSCTSGLRPADDPGSGLATSSVVVGIVGEDPGSGSVAGSVTLGDGRSGYQTQKASHSISGCLISNRLMAGDSAVGFTLLELLIVAAMVGILSAIAAPVWLSFADNQRLSQAQDAAFRTLRIAQARARQNRRVWELCLRDTGRSVELAVQPARTGFCDNARWEPLLAEATGTIGVAIDVDNSTLRSRSGVYRMQFQGSGWVNGQLGRITFQLRDRVDSRRSCVFVSTLLGALRGDRDRACLR